MSQALIFERIEKGRAYFKSKDNETVVLPESFVSKELKEGETIHLSLSREDSLAKDILNELLDTKN